jgi:uncharacterized iron-regulated membrane protein
MGYSRKNQLTTQVSGTDLIVGGLILAAVAGIVYVGYLGNQTAASAPPSPAPSPAPTPATAATPPAGGPLPVSGASQVSWQPSGNQTPPATGQTVAATAQDSSGNIYTVAGQVTTIDSQTVTFTPSVVSASLPSMNSLTLPYDYVTPLAAG